MQLLFYYASLISFFGTVSTSSIFRVNSNECSALVTQELLKEKWLLADNMPGGFCNQLFGIYSYVPLARLLNVGVIVGPVYSRKSFTVTYDEFLLNYIKLPFSAFFDMDHFAQYWAYKGVRVLDKRIYAGCLNKTAFVPIVRPKFFCFKDDAIFSMVSESNVTIADLAPGDGVQVVGHEGLMAFYNHLQSGGRNLANETDGTPNMHLKQLAEVHSSIVPSAKIWKIAKHTVEGALQSNFIGIHLRVEKDVLLDDGLDFDAALPGVIKYITDHRCLYSHNVKGTYTPHNGPNQPIIYLASGLFTTGLTKGAVETPSSLYRTKRVLEAFKEAGFTNVMTRSSINALDHVSLYDDVHAEQHAYIDLLVLKKSTCFIATPRGSSLSYMVERFKAFDEGDFGGDLLKQRGLEVTSYFQAWGF